MLLQRRTDLCGRAVTCSRYEAYDLVVIKFCDGLTHFEGVGESPLMTWGEIEGTPFALDASDTPMRLSTPGPQFKIPEIPERDKLHLNLVDNVGKRHRAKHEEALQRVRSLAS